MPLLPLLLLACTGPTPDDTGVEPTDTDEEEAGPEGSVTGTVIHADGTVASDMEVQVCSVLCRYTKTDAGGNFSVGALEAARFKIDAMGYVKTAPGFGNSLYGVDLGVDQAFVLPAPLVVPPAEGPVVANENSGEQTYVMGQVSLTFTASTLDLPNFIAEDNGDFPLFAGVLEGTELTPLWSVTPSFAVALLPWGTEHTETSEGMGIVVTGLTSPDGTYDVYALKEYGEVEGPLGTATVAKGTATATAIKPEVWTWLMFVPA